MPKMKRISLNIFCVCVSITGCWKQFSFCLFPQMEILQIFSLIILKKVQILFSWDNHCQYSVYIFPARYLDNILNISGTMYYLLFCILCIIL